MRAHFVVAAAFGGAVLLAAPASAEIAASNAAGVAMGPRHYRVKDVEAHTRFWTTLGGRLLKPQGDAAVVALAGVLVFLSRGDSSGGADGSVVNHVAFRVPT